MTDDRSASAPNAPGPDPQGHDLQTHGTHDPSALNDFLVALENEGELTRVSEEVSVHAIGRLVTEHPRAVLFEHVRGYDMAVAANLLASRNCWAVAMGVAPDEVRQEIGRRLGSLIAPHEVARSGLHEVVSTGDEVDITTIPAYLQHSEDGGPYISAAMDISKSPDSGAVNLGIRRLMVRGRQETGVDVVAPSDLRAYYTKARQLGHQFDVAFVVGGHPLDYLASQLKVGPVDDFELAGGLRGKSVPLVRCRTIDMMVPADADIVLEGHFVGGWDEIEGPYGEYHGSLGPPHRNPVFRITALTRRLDAVFQSATIGNPRLGHTDTAMFGAVKSELMVWAALERAIANPCDVYCPPAAGGRQHVRIQIVNRDPGDSRNALLAALSCQADLKHAIVVDEDIDIRDDDAVEWATSTRFQADQDTIILEGLRTLPLEPSLDKGREGGVVTSKLGIDATRNRAKPQANFAASETLDGAVLDSGATPGPPGTSDEVLERLTSILDQPRSYAEFVTLLPDVHQRDLLVAIGTLRQTRRLLSTDDGRYGLVDPLASH